MIRKAKPQQSGFSNKWLASLAIIITYTCKIFSWESDSLTYMAISAVAVVVIQTVSGVTVALAAKTAVRSHNHQVHVETAGSGRLQGLGADISTSRTVE